VILGCGRFVGENVVEGRGGDGGGVWIYIYIYIYVYIYRARPKKRTNYRESEREYMHPRDSAGERAGELARGVVTVGRGRSRFGYSVESRTPLRGTNQKLVF